MTIGDIRNDLKERFVDKPTAEKLGCLWERLDYAHMDEEWKQNCKTDNWWAESTEILSHRPDFEQLKDLCEIRDRLLAKGGDMAYMPPSPDEDTRAILKYGQFWNGVGARLCLGRLNQCHVNSCCKWAIEKDDSDNDPKFEIHICTGFALCNDGMWYEHSWLVEKDKIHRTPIIIETTIPRLLYFGYVLDDYRATDLYYQQIDDGRMGNVEGFKEPVGYDDYLDYAGNDGFYNFSKDVVDTDDFEIPSEPVRENERE